MALVALYSTTIGKKIVMAVTGVILVGYVVLHMLGNLKAFQGADKLNAYGVFLREVGAPVLTHEQGLWLVRIILLVAALLHIVAAVQLKALDHASRPIGYRTRRSVSSSVASRTMFIGGILLAAFIVFHILHLTTGTVHASFREGDVYHNVVAGLSAWPVALFYIVSMVALGFHLYHGVWSTFQTLGLNNRGRTRFWGGVASITAVVTAVGMITVPLAVIVGLLR